MTKILPPPPKNRYKYPRMPQIPAADSLVCHKKGDFDLPNGSVGSKLYKNGIQQINDRRIEP